jgi:hypothetical protein
LLDAAQLNVAQSDYCFRSSADGLEERNGIVRCGKIVLDPAALFAAAAEDSPA